MQTAKKITDFINAIRELSGVGICYYDLNTFFHYDQYGIKNNRGHYCEFCEKTRALSGGRAACEKSDKDEAIMLAKQYREPFFYECHMGMRELVIPLIREETLLGLIFVGQSRTEDASNERLESNVRRLGGDPLEFLQLYQRLPIVSQKDILNIGTILTQYFDVRIWNNELISSDTTSMGSGLDLAEVIYRYVQLNYRHKLSAKDIASEFHVNASYASRRFSQRYQITITEHISRVRTERAKMLLQETEAPIGNIALNVGFDDINYFSRVFKKITSISPLEYRKSFR